MERTPGRGRRRRALAAATAAFVALTAVVATVPAQAAPPSKLAERRCLDAGGQFLWQATQYSCTGLGSTAVIASADRQCRHSYKGYAFSWWRDPVAGTWAYICSFPV